MSLTFPGGIFRLWLDLAATLAAVSGCAVLLWLNWSTFFPPRARLPEAPVSLEGASLRGDPTAPVVVIEFSDFMCPFCARFEAEVLPELASRHIDTGRVQWAFRHHPIERLHPGATMAAVSALCAGRQDKFWEMHSALFQNPTDQSEARLIATARELGLNGDSFARCLLAEEAADQVKLDVAEAEALGLTGTPAFLVGRRLKDGTVRVVSVVNGARPIAEFDRAIGRAGRPEWSIPAILTGGGAIGLLAVHIIRRMRVRRVGVKTNERNRRLIDDKSAT